MTMIIDAGSGKKPRRRKKLFMPNSFGMTEWLPEEFGASMSPYHDRDYYNHFKDDNEKFLDSMDLFSTDEIDWNCEIRLGCYTSIKISELFFNLFKGGKFRQGIRRKYYDNQYFPRSSLRLSEIPETVQFLSLVDPPAFPHVEMVSISVPRPNYFWQTYLNDPEIDDNYFKTWLYVSRDVFSLEVMFKGKDLKKPRKGLVFPLTNKDSRVPESEQRILTGNFFAATYQKKKVFTEFHNINKYFSGPTKGMIAAINHKRFYEV